MNSSVPESEVPASTMPGAATNGSPPEGAAGPAATTVLDPVPTITAAGTAVELSTASQGRLVWRAFRRHKLAMIGAAIVIMFYLIALFGEFLAPYNSDAFHEQYPYAPPQLVHWVDFSGGSPRFGPYVHGYTSQQDAESLQVSYVVDESVKIPIRFFDTSTESYRMWGLFEGNVHLIGPVDDSQPMYLLGSDRNGRDVLSRIIHGTRVSMTIGLVGVAIAFLLGVSLGGVSGFFGGRIDTVLQRLVEFFMSIPTLPLWLGLAAALPADWGPLRRYFAITVILAIIAWTDLARVVRGRFLSLREEEFVTSAHLDGNPQPRVIFRHMLPSFTSHLIASLTLSIPAMILAETSLSFLGLGLQPPVVSWGVLLNDAQNIRTISTAPWLMLPGLAVIV
ncbi:MAG TPA: ABC transporter permease, partial [Microlunatus sp.]|nr:ABC transporter permease [Microlunatus sp.]